jgi:hypothetical protein
VVAIESGRAEVLVVRDLAVRQRMSEISLAAMLGARASRRGLSEPLSTGVARHDVVRLVRTWPEAIETRSGALSLIYPLTGNLNSPRGGLGSVVAQLWRQGPSVGSGEQWLASAVAIAGLEASASNRRRAVVLVLGETATDRSLFSPAQARDFLAALQVPLEVWRVAEEGGLEGWGEAQEAGTLRQMNRAIRAVGHRLDPQLVVWLDGRHLPQDIRLAPGAGNRIRLAGR